MSEEVKEEEVVQEISTMKEEPSPEEKARIAAEEEIKKARIIQIIQYNNTGRIEITPVQNIKFRSDIIGILVQALNNIDNEDLMNNNALLLKEAIRLIKEPPKESK